MVTIHLQQSTTATPEEFVAALTDFGPGRSEIFSRSADDYLKVHELGTNHADVTEGSGGVWERMHYDWSDVNHVVVTTTDSNAWGGRSGFTYTLTRRADGATNVDLVEVREAKTIKGCALSLLIHVIGSRVLGKELEHAVNAIEARINRGATGAA